VQPFAVADLLVGIRFGPQDWLICTPFRTVAGLWWRRIDLRRWGRSGERSSGAAGGFVVRPECTKKPMPSDLRI